jgi:predicted dehydrogenase
MLSRRKLLTSGLAAGAALALNSKANANSTAKARSTRRAQSDELRVAVVGLRGRGRDHVEALRKLPGVRLAALCDVDRDVLARETARLAEPGIELDVPGYRDLRQLLDEARVDALSIATPNHWHALQAIWACEAGAHVYVEKPVSHNVWEGRQLVKAARKHERIVAAGLQCRSSAAIAEAIRWVHEDHLGRIELARGLCYKPRPSIGKVDGPQPVPEAVDFELWTGPAPLKPLQRKNLHYDWHWVRDTGNGDLGNQGVHQMDLARWALRERGPAPEVISVGGRLGYGDDGETPNTQLALHLYPRAPLLFEVRGLPRDSAAQQANWGQGMDAYDGLQIGVVLHCEGGKLCIPTYDSAIAYDAQGEELRRWQGADDPFASFIAAIRSGQRQDLGVDIEEGHISSALCHYANISHALGAPASQDDLRAEIEVLVPLADACERAFAHLEANGVDLKATPLTLGRRLRIDPSSEGFVGDEEANRLLTRPYREPFVVREV